MTLVGAFAADVSGLTALVARLRAAKASALRGESTTAAPTRGHRVAVGAVGAQVPDLAAVEALARVDR